MLKWTGLLLCAVYQTVVAAQDLSRYERILLPVLYVNVSGAYGSLWTSEVAMHNGAQIPAYYLPAYCQTATCVAPFVAPGEAGGVAVIPAPADDPPGRLIYVPKEIASQLSFELRIQDVSRQEQSWGTEIPVVREKDLFTQNAYFFPVPLDRHFRVRLRVYDFDYLGSSAVDVVGRLEDGTVLRVIHVPLPVVTNPTSPLSAPPYAPGYGEIVSISDAFPVPSNIDRIQVEVKPVNPGLRFWAMVSITNNETQHVTIVSPH